MTRFQVTWLLGMLALAWTGTDAFGSCTVRYVWGDWNNGNNDGTTWFNAFHGSSALQNAIDSAEACIANEVCECVDLLVAGGTYKPSLAAVSGQPESKTFRMVDKVNIYGGYFYGDGVGDRIYGCSGGINAGRPCETDADCSGGDCYEDRVVILSGDIDDDDTLNDGNAYHVVSYAIENGDVTIDGVVIKFGYAGGDTPSTNQGSAINIRDIGTCKEGSDNEGNPCLVDDDCSEDPDEGDCEPPPACLSGGPMIRNCLIRDNYSSDHGAVNDHGSTTEFDNCVFDNNVADPAGNGRGGALLIDNGSATIANCIFRNNQAHGGGALWIETSAATGCPEDPIVTITDSRFEENSATERGTAVFLEDSELTIVNSIFSQNIKSAGGSGTGGGIWTQGAVLTLDGCIFQDNEVANGGGGAIYNNSSTMHATNCDFIGNSAGFGGAIYDTLTNTTMEYCKFKQNTSNSNGGDALYIDGCENCETVYANCEFIANTGSFAANVFSANAVFSNTLFSANAQAIRLNHSNVLTVHNCTFAYNGGYGIFVGGGPNQSVTVRNSILWGNNNGACDFQIRCGQSGDCSECGNGNTLVVTHSNVQNGSDFTGGDGNISSDPLFVDYLGPDETLRTGDEDFRLESNSPCRDSGDNGVAGLPELDLDGYCRIVGSPPIVDMGAYEYGGSTAECCETSDCDGGEVCCDNACETGGCCESVDCGGGEVCCDYTCTSGDCCDSSDCGGSTPYCSGSNECVACLTNGHCGSGKVCCDGVCYSGTCCTNDDCFLGTECYSCGGGRNCYLFPPC